MVAYLFQVLLAIDQLFCALTGGLAHETLSARAWRLQHRSLFWGFVLGVIDGVFFWDPNHCEDSYLYVQLRAADTQKQGTIAP